MNPYLYDTGKERYQDILHDVEQRRLAKLVQEAQPQRPSRVRAYLAGRLEALRRSIAFGIQPVDYVH